MTDLDTALVEAAQKLARLCVERGLSHVQFNISGTKITIETRSYEAHRHRVHYNQA